MSKTRWILLVVILILGVGGVFAYGTYRERESAIVVPVLLEDGTIGAEFERKPSLLAALTLPLFDRSAVFLTLFHPNEIGIAKIGSSQSDAVARDIIVFHCSTRVATETPIKASEVFSDFHSGRDQWLWGPYAQNTGPGGPDQDEGRRLRRWVGAGRPAVHPDHPNNVFPDKNGGPGNKFGGRATGLSFVNPNYTLPLSGGRYVASANVPAGQYNKVRCARVVVCGDGWSDQPEEQCDDGNTVNDDGCTNLCRLPTCGDGIVQAGEPCDDGNASNTDACRNGCIANVCGDGFVNVGVEDCDDGKTCMGLDGKGNPIGDARWCTTDADCASQPGTTCANHFNPTQIPAGSFGDGCMNNCTQEGGAVCLLKERKNPGIPESSFCTFGVPVT